MQEYLALFSSVSEALVYREHFRFSSPQKCIPWSLTIFLCHNLFSFNSRFTGVIRLQIDRKLSKMSQFQNKCYSSIRDLISLFEKSSAFRLGLPILRVPIWGISTKFHRKRQRGEKTYHWYHWRNVPYTKLRTLSYLSWKLVNRFVLGKNLKT